MSTGENESGLRRIVDFLRLGSLFILMLHGYFYCYAAFNSWQLTLPLTDRVLKNVANTGLFSHFNNAKYFSLGLLVISLLGTKGRKDEHQQLKGLLGQMFVGVAVYFGSRWLFYLNVAPTGISITYMAVTAVGYLLILSSGSRLSRLLKVRLSKDVFNDLNETFPQEERLLQNAYSINLPARYRLKYKVRRSWINIINPFRGLLVVGSPGAGKSWFVIQHIIKQHIEKGFAMFIYDFKYDDLSKIAYNWWKANLGSYAVIPQFHVLSFDHLSQSSRCNPLDPAAMHDITDASEAARAILLGLNREWINKQGDFFVESPINFLTAVIWFLRHYEEGKYCTLPHVIELMQVNYEELFAVLNTEPEIEVLINPFMSAYQNDAMEQLEGQIASAKIGMARLASPQLYWVLSASDFTLDINNPQQPKIICMGNNPEKQQIYGAVLSLYISRLIRQVNKKDRLPCSLIFDEFPTIFLNHMDAVIATARSNKVATTLAMQDFSQLRKDYGREQADVIVNITGNLICGQVMGDTAKVLSERFGKIQQEKQSISVNRMDTSISRSTQLEYVIPISKISALSSGEFVGMVADDPDQQIKLKAFHAEIVNNPAQLNKEMTGYEPIPHISEVTQEQITDNYYQVKLDVKRLVEKEVSKLKGGADS